MSTKSRKPVGNSGTPRRPDKISEGGALGDGTDSARDRGYDAAVHSLGEADDDDAIDGAGDDDSAGADGGTIFTETGHIPDRDQTFGVDHKEFPGEATPGLGWSGDEEDAVKGDRDNELDAFDDLSHVGHITRAEAKAPSRLPTPAAIAGNHSGDLEGLTEAELSERAKALGIPGRQRMGRLQLAQAVRDAAPHA